MPKHKSQGRVRFGDRGRGRQKIEIKKMKKVANLHVTFSKRRIGIFKKASELCTLCAAEVAIIIFSPGNKAFSFGHPSVKSVIDRFMNTTQQPHTPSNMEFVTNFRHESIHNLNTTLVEIIEELDNEKKLRLATNMILKQFDKTPVSDMSLEQLDKAQAAIDKVMPKLINLSNKFASSRNIVTDVSTTFYTENSSSTANIAFSSTHNNPLGFMNNTNFVSEQGGLFTNNPIATLEHVGLNNNSNVFDDVVPYNPNMVPDNPYLVPNNGGNVVPYIGSMDNSNVMPNNGGFVNNLNFGSNNRGFVNDPSMMFGEGFVHDRLGRDEMF